MQKTRYASAWELIKSDRTLQRIYELFDGLSESRRRDLAAIARAMCLEDKRRKEIRQRRRKQPRESD